MVSRGLLILVILVLLPVVLLTREAVRTIELRELAADAAMRRNARLALDNAAWRIEQEISRLAARAVAEVRAAPGEVTHDPGVRMAAVDAGLRAAEPAVARLYVYQDPWGFLYPAGGSAEELALTDELRTRLARRATGDERTAFAWRNSLYVFSTLDPDRARHVGVRLEEPAVLEMVARVCAAAPAGSFVVRAQGPGASDEPGVVVSDSAGGLLVAAPPGTVSADGLAARRLAAPLDHLVLRAFAPSAAAGDDWPARQRRWAEWAIRLTAGWTFVGIVLLGWVVIRELRMARRNTDFVIGVSHDLRTPLASMRMLAESLLMEGGTDAERRTRYLNSIVQQAERLSHMIERVLYLVRFGQDAMRFTRARVDLRDLVARTVNEFGASVGGAPVQAGTGAGEAPYIQAPGVCLYVQLPADPVDTRGDVKALGQVLFNLLDNAVKYGRFSAETAAQVTVRLQREVCVHGVVPLARIDVADRGPGLDRRELARLFRRFHRSERARALHVAGMGLGLAMCREIVRRHGGTIGAESRPGTGTTFTVRLPLTR